MSYTLGQAARAANRSKPTIARAIQRDRLSAIRAEDGSYRIDPAELFRAYPGAGQSNGTLQQSVPVTSEMPAVLRVERDRLLAEREGLLEAIRDLRVRLDRSEDERRQVQERLTGLLTHRQAGSVPAVMPRVPWWQRWFR
jgi:signal transduction histidine kinase